MIVSSTPPPSTTAAAQPAVTAAAAVADRLQPGTTIARMVLLASMPGEGVDDLLVREQIAPDKPWNSIDDAKAAIRELTLPEQAGAAGIFRRNGAYEAYWLDSANSGFNPQPLFATSDSVVARTNAGRGLAAIVDGHDEPTLLSARDFRAYARMVE